MSPLNIKRSSIVAVIIICVGVIVWQLLIRMTGSEPMTVREASSKVESLYNGKIVNVQEQKNLFVIVIELASGIYEIEVDRDTGEIGSLTPVNHKAGEESQQENPSSQAPNTNVPNSSQVITEEEAKAIALQQISGKVDELLIKDIDGVTYYFVKVEQQSGEEGIVQIHGLTGDVVSITWDD